MPRVVEGGRKSNARGDCQKEDQKEGSRMETRWWHTFQEGGKEKMRSEALMMQGGRDEG